jgi:hypothetical protein
MQSEPSKQAALTAQSLAGAQPPPQSVAVSLPFFTPSPQVGD